MENKKDKKELVINKKSDFYVKVTLSSFEAALIRKLRQYEWGEFRIFKQKGEPRRCEVIGSEILRESEGLALELEEKTKTEINGGL